MQEIIDAMKWDRIGAAGDHLVVKNRGGGTPQRLPGLPNREGLVETVAELDKARARQNELQQSLDRM